MLGIILRLLGRDKHIKALTFFFISLLLMGIGMQVFLS